MVVTIITAIYKWDSEENLSTYVGLYYISQSSSFDLQ